MRRWPLYLAVIGAFAAEAAAQTMPTREDGILNAFCIQSAEKSCPGGAAPTGAAPRQIELDYRSERDAQFMDPHYAASLAAALKRAELADQCFEIHVEGAHETTRDYAIALTHLHAVRIEAILVQHGVARDRLATIGRGKPDTPRTAGTPAFRAILKTRLGGC